MSFIYGHDENAVPSHGKQSSNAFATGADQNCGNVITDRPTTRLHAPPGGHSSIRFGDEDSYVPPGRASRQAQADQYSSGRSNVSSQVFGQPSSGGGAYQSSNAFANASDPNGGNFITDRSSTRLAQPPGGRSQIAFGDVDNAPDNYSRRPDTAAFAAKEREQIGSDIFGAAAPAQSARQQMQQQHAQQQYAEDQYGDDTTYEEVHAPSHVEATEVDVKAMTHGDLRMLCRDHGLSPAGGKETLVERLVDAMHAGQIKVIVPNKGASGVSSVGNNYGRADGQNVGNFMTGRSSSRVLAPPGGGSSFSFGNDGSENAQRGSGGGGNAQHSISTAKLANDSRGRDVFGDGPGVVARFQNATKKKEMKGHDVFDDAPDPTTHDTRRGALNDLKLTNDLKGHDVFGNVATPKRPGTALSDAKRREMYGRDIFQDGICEQYAKNVQGTMRFSDARAAAVAGMVGHDIFSDGDDRFVKRPAGKHAGGGPSLVTF